MATKGVATTSPLCQRRALAGQSLGEMKWLNPQSTAVAAGNAWHLELFL